MVKQWLLIPLLWILVGGVYGGWIYQLPEAKHKAEREFRWKTVTWQAVDIEKSLLDIRNAQPWGAPPPPPGVAAVAKVEEPLTPPPWKILGAVKSSMDAYVSVQVGNQPIVDIKAGESLPDGSKIERIENDRLYLVVRGKKRILRLFSE